MSKPEKNKENNRQPYIKPEIIYELDLETKAGSPLGNPIDPLNPGAPDG